LLAGLALAYFALSPTAQALLPPPAPDGGYPNGNTAEGDNALFNLTTGLDNTAVGFNALFSNTTGFDNTATGAFALQNNISQACTADGAGALRFNTTGNDNTATGATALFLNTTGFNNTATGSRALETNNTGSENTADGHSALGFNLTGSNNTATGTVALLSNRTGNNNTADGQGALTFNSMGSNNTATGRNALSQNTTGSSNIAVGFRAGLNLTTGNDNIDIGNGGVAGESSTIRIGIFQTRTFIAGIAGVAVTGSPVVVNANGRLGVSGSSIRFKEAIKPMDKASEAILALKPVTFFYKHDLDPEGIPQFGLIAEQVAKVNPDLVARDEQGKPYTVRYEAVNAMLLNEFLKEHKTVQEQEATIAQLKQDSANQQKQIEALTAGLRKVSAQIELSKAAPQTVLNNR